MDEPLPDDTMLMTGEEVALAELDRRARMQEACDAVITRLTMTANDRVTKRSPIEQRWLSDTRQYHGRIDRDDGNPEVLLPSNKSRAIINMTRPKTKAWESRLSDLLLPADDKNWGISPTPVPELSDSAKEYARAAEAKHQEAAALVEEHNRDAETGAETQPEGAALAQAASLGEEAASLTAKELESRNVLDVAKRCSENMAHEMDDQLTQCQYPRLTRRALGDMCKLGSGVMKGPLNGRPAQRWQKNVDEESGAPGFDLKPANQGNSPVYKRVDPWNFFPDDNATDMASSESEFERHLPNKTMLRRMARELDFEKDVVAELLKQGPGYGTATDLNHLTLLRSITNEGQAITERYVVWEYHGPLECDEVETVITAMQGSEAAATWKADYSELDEIRVVIYFCDGRLLKIEPDWLLDSNETLYSVVSFEKAEGSVLGGYGVPSMMRDPARAVAAAMRMLLDNSGLSVGPQILIDKSRVAPEDGSWALAGRKVWLKTGNDISTDSPPFQVFNIPSNVGELIQTIELSLKFIDETTSLPLIAQGEQGAHITQTAGGMSMLMNSANVIFRGVVKNIDDDLTTPNMRRLYDWNMQFNPKEEIKGDMQVEARGTSALLVREMQSQNLMAMAQNWSGHPVLGMAIKPYDAVRLAVASLSINPDDVLVTRDEFDQARKDAAQNQPQDPRIVGAQIDAESRKLQGDVQREVAGLRLQEAIAGIQARTGETREKIAADLQKHADSIQSAERMKATDIAVEDERATRARALGQPEANVIGKGVG